MSMFFLATGPIQTARILFKSGFIDRSNLLLLESRKAIVPFLSMSANRQDHQYFALANFSVKHRVPDKIFHYAQISPFTKYAFAAQGIHSELLFKLTSLLRRRAFVSLLGVSSHETPVLSLNPKTGAVQYDHSISNNEFRHSHIRTAVRDHKRFLSRAGCFVIGTHIRYLPAGAGNHIGGTFGAMAQQKEKRADNLGRLLGLGSLSIVDSSVLDAIPDHGISMFASANARAIASTVVGLG